MSGDARRKGIGIAAAVVAVALLIGGVFGKHDVLLMDAEQLAKDFDLPPPFKTMDDYVLVINTTFSGVVVKDSRLHFTYDPNKPLVGKRPCPT